MNIWDEIVRLLDGPKKGHGWKEKLADDILSLPTGYEANGEPVTVGEVLEKWEEYADRNMDTHCAGCPSIDHNPECAYGNFCSIWLLLTRDGHKITRKEDTTSPSSKTGS